MAQRKALYLNENNLSIELIVAGNLLSVFTKHAPLREETDVILQDAHEHILALRDWCNEVLAESEPKRVSAFEDNFIETRKRIGQVGFKEENQ